ncbi:Ig-like domain-containing protein [Clostridium sp. MB40-C1]|uniref:Ig-like domain-containing protein n=1 Tax=Clostridium sp. MB40-C1 TaxID=3070996 RepID=UPI0027DFD70F|nr:Ig-like domain-containing protein [Clostridium sp. MB40-C1]WMJ81710.1 Ig-like domain-containing protein [Clostridium sp. MB40-C1]
MKKIIKIRGFVGALILTFSFSTIASAKPMLKIEQKNSKTEEMLKQKKNDKMAMELQKINIKLDKIEKDIKYTSERINKYFSTETQNQGEVDQEETNQDTENQDVVNEEETNQEVESQDPVSQEETNQDIENQDLVDQEEFNNEVENQTTDDIVATTSEENSILENTDTETVTEEDQDAINEEVSDVTEENTESEDTEEEENISGHSFIGKLNALNNRIESIKKQLNSPSGKLDKTSEEYAKIVDRIVKLKKDISDNMEKLKNFQSPVLEKLKNKIAEQKEYTPKNKLVETNKTWTIRFNKNLKLESFNGKNIFVVDSDNTLVETKIAFDKETGAIKITPVENYIKGKKYTLFISKDVKSDKGSVLSQATRVPFEIK